MPVDLESHRVYVGRIDRSLHEGDVGCYALHHERPVSDRPKTNDILYHGISRSEVVSYLHKVGLRVDSLEVVNGVDPIILEVRDTGFSCTTLPDMQFRSIIQDANLVEKTQPRVQRNPTIDGLVVRA